MFLFYFVSRYVLVLSDTFLKTSDDLIKCQKELYVIEEILGGILVCLVNITKYEHEHESKNLNRF